MGRRLTKTHEWLGRLGGGECGSAAAELGLVIPLFVLLTIGLYNLAFLMFAANSLHLSVERAARCASVTPTVCPNTASVQTYGTSQYTGPAISPSYVLTPATATNCGNKVSATATFRFTSGVANFNVPVNAASCFPSMT
jgi:Flp pilus assembly protein TadG